MTNYFASDEVFYRQCFYRRKLFSSDKVFQVTIVEQSILNLLSFLPHLRNGSGTIKAFKQKILPFIHRLENSILKIFNPERLKLVTPLGLGFSQSNEHHFGDNFQECLNSLCTWGWKQKITLTICCTTTITPPFVLILQTVKRHLLLSLWVLIR